MEHFQVGDRVRTVYKTLKYQNGVIKEQVSLDAVVVLHDDGEERGHNVEFLEMEPHPFADDTQKKKRWWLFWLECM